MDRFSRRTLLEGGAAVLPPALLGMASGCRASPPAEQAAPIPGAASLGGPREALVVLDARPTVEGAGVRLRRSLGSAALPLLDPFLLLDEIRSDVVDDYVRGFPEHPHRGFETVTYMIEGEMEHRDSVGNHGLLGPGSAQWMTAGHGIVHSEMPRRGTGLFWGLQLWVNLPGAEKMRRPRYQDVRRERIPELGVEGARVRLVAGSIGAEHGPVDGIAVAPLLMDVALAPGGRFEHELPATHGAFAYVLEGAVEIGGSRAPARRGQIAPLGPGAYAALRSASGGRVLLAAGRQLGEPVARRGPFVMNTDEELRQAFEDYRTGRLVEGS